MSSRDLLRRTAEIASDYLDRLPERQGPAVKREWLFLQPSRRGVAGPRAPMGAERFFSARTLG